MGGSNKKTFAYLGSIFWKSGGVQKMLNAEFRMQNALPEAFAPGSAFIGQSRW